MEAYATDHSRALLTHILVPWALGVARLAPSKWILPPHLAPSCAFGETSDSLCGAFAVGACHVCGRPICMKHALIAADATLVCWTCMRTAAKHATPWQPPSTGAAGSPSDLGWAYELLGIEPGATAAEVKKAYKKRIAQFHPDKQSVESAAHGQLVKLITKAYEAISASAPPSK